MTPALGSVSALPALTTVIITAAIDSINPCAIGVLILLVSTLIAVGKKSEMLKLGMIYIGAVYVTYLLAGLGLTAFWANIPQSWAEYIAIIVGAVVVFGGLLEIKDYFWYGAGMSLAIAPRYTKRIQEMSQKVAFGTVVVLGIFVAAVELPCTGGPYLAITLILSQNFNMTAFYLLLFYNVIFVMPLVIILLLVLAGKKIHDIKQWKAKYKGIMRLAIGYLLIGLGWLLMLIANGNVNLN